jgi:polyphosphate glucokinase
VVVLGVDIGGSGIKGAPVDLAAGGLAAERYRVETPRPSDVASVVAAVAEVVASFPATERVGVTFPGVVTGGVVRTAANMHPSWVDAPAAELFAAAVGRPVTVLNDADAAGVAEVAFGAGRGRAGTCVMLTFGTGIGSAVFLDGRLLPNTEFGHLEFRGGPAEHYASDRVRKEQHLDWPAWAARVREYLLHVRLLVSPDLFVIGGGVSKKAELYLPLLDVGTPVVPAALLNNAGIVGAAMAAALPAPAAP